MTLQKLFEELSQLAANSFAGAESVNIDEFELRCTCGACPEQYDVYRGERQVAYFRLRHGEFTVEVPDACGEVVYRANPEGDGVFKREERQGYLEAGLKAVSEYLERIEG